jgi:hypothetical protein
MSSTENSNQSESTVSTHSNFFTIRVEFFNHFAFKVGALVGVNPLRYAIMYYEVIKESFSCCFSKLILGWDGLGISSIVEYAWVVGITPKTELESLLRSNDPFIQHYKA